jgi:hypothetical protein
MTNAASDRMKILKDRVIYSHYLAANTRFNNRISGKSPNTIGGTNASNESSALLNISKGAVNITKTEETTIIRSAS